MMRYFCLAVTICAACALLIACQGAGSKAPVVKNTSPNPVVATPHGDGARRIKVDELRQALAQNEAIVVDVRGEGSYKAGHIRGALWVPEGEIAGRAGELPRDKMIVTYCS